jgi:hypothetical protein
MVVAPRLRAYVRRYMLEKARDYAYPRKRRTPDSTRSAFRDLMNGTDTGAWSELIYTRDLLDLFNRYRGGTRDAILDLISETGARWDQPAGRGPDAFTYAELICSTTRRQTWDDYTSESEKRAREADAATFALRLAVEYLAGDVAAQFCPDL